MVSSRTLKILEIGFTALITISWGLTGCSLKKYGDNELFNEIVECLFDYKYWICLVFSVVATAFLIFEWLKQENPLKIFIRHYLEYIIRKIFYNDTKRCRISIFKNDGDKLKLYCYAVQPSWKIKSLKATSDEKSAESYIAYSACIKNNYIINTVYIDDFFTEHQKEYNKNQNKKIEKYKNETLIRNDKLLRKIRVSNHLCAMPIYSEEEEVVRGILVVDILDEENKDYFTNEVVSQLTEAVTIIRHALKLL